MTHCFSSEARVRAAQVRPERTNYRSATPSSAGLVRPTTTARPRPCKRLESRLDLEARKKAWWPEQASARSIAARRFDSLVHPGVQASAVSATGSLRGLDLDGADYGRHASGDQLPENPVIHTIVRLRPRAGPSGPSWFSMEPWNRSPPGSSHPVDASGREIRTGLAGSRSSETVVSAGHTPAESAETPRNSHGNSITG